MKKILVFAMLAMFLAPIVANAQHIQIGGIYGYSKTTTRSDSTSFRDKYYIDIPDGITTDTLQIQFWCKTTRGVPHLKIRHWAALRIWDGVSADNWVVSKDSTSLSSDWTTDSTIIAFPIINNSADSLYLAKTGTSKKWNWKDGVRIMIGGYTSNSGLTKYRFKVFGKKEENYKSAN